MGFRKMIKLFLALAILIVLGARTQLGFGTRAGNVNQNVSPVGAIHELPLPAAASTSTNAFVIRAVDGDTLLVRFDGETEESRIRLLGINTPETVDPRKPVECFGKEASKHMHELVDGKRIRLDADPQADERDKYDRLLRNVFLDDGSDVNAAMVKDGYAYAYLSFPLTASRKRELKKLEEDARIAGRGLWNPNTCNGKK